MGKDSVTDGWSALLKPAFLPAVSVLVGGVLLHSMNVLMLATVIEGRLLGINPYNQPGVEVYRRNMRAILKG